MGILDEIDNAITSVLATVEGFFNQTGGSGNPGGSHTPEHRSAQRGAAEIAEKQRIIAQERAAARAQSGTNLFGIER